jgi:predicted PurR-regulated permease PerM
MNTPRTVFPVTDSTPASRLLTLAGIVVVIAGLYFGRQVLIPLALALILMLVALLLRRKISCVGNRPWQRDGSLPQHAPPGR